MEYKIIKTEEYLLIVDDSGINIIDWCYDTEEGNVFKVKEQCFSGIIKSDSNTYVEDFCKKIIAHLPLNDSPFLEGVDLLPYTNKETPIEFTCETIFMEKEKAGDKYYWDSFKKNTSINQDGNTIWLGTYIY